MSLIRARALAAAAARRAIAPAVTVPAPNGVRIEDAAGLITDPATGKSHPSYVDTDLFTRATGTQREANRPTQKSSASCVALAPINDADAERKDAFSASNRTPFPALRLVEVGHQHGETMPKGRQVVRPLAERFWEKVDKSGKCWEWTAFIHPKGYGMFGVGRVVRRAHRVSYELAHGPIPDGLWVLHRCDNRRCVRPDHLFLGTVQDNTADMVAKGRNRNPRAEAQRAQTRCLRGHEYTPENTKRYQGKRSCLICRRAAVRAYAKRQRDKRLAQAVA